MDKDAQNVMAFAQNGELQALIEELAPYIESSSMGDVIWAEVASI